MDGTVRIENCKIAFFRDFYPEAPTNSISLTLILFVGRMTIDEIANIFMDHGADPSIRGGVELEAFLLLGLNGSDFDLFAGDGAVDLIGRRLFDGFGGECLFGRRDDGERVVKIVLWMVTIGLELWLHLLN
jgi:hypothetical protein